jgi:gamma-glutamyltranspeptidase / glutathione hydrolase / leukotriene-C4 hydrolase
MRASKSKDSSLIPRPSSFKLLIRLISASILLATTTFFLFPLQSRNPAYLIQVRNGAVASENKRCSDIGVDVLKDGGNAVDASIAATLCIGVVNMFSLVSGMNRSLIFTHTFSSRSGIGGGGFMTIRIPPSNLSANNSLVYTIDFREVAPASSNSTMFKSNPQSSKFGGLAIGVPGELRGLEEAHRRWGTLPWMRLFAPSISLAQGWEVDTELGKRIPVGSFLPFIQTSSRQ